MIDGWYWLLLFEGTLLICPILWFVVRKSYYGRKLLSIKTRKVHDFYWFWIVFNLSLAVSDYFKHKSIDYIIMDVLFALFGIPFIMISILFLKVEIREEGICSMFGILEWEKIFSYSFFEGKRKGMGFPRKNRHQIKRLFFDFQNFPGSSIQLKCADVFDCNKSQYTQRFHV